ncbi:MAG: FAD-dependent oxidoreductase [Vicinamibacterales bacterium]
MSDRLDVLVVGAGPIGLTLACHLQRLGLSVRLIEKRAGPSVHSKAIGLQYRVSEVLATLGVIDRFLAQGGSPTTVNLYTGQERLIQLRFVAPTGISGRDAFRPCAILIPQSQTEQILIQYFRELGGTVEWETELVGYSQQPDGVIAQVQRLGSMHNITADWLVSCEGAHSVVRKRADIAFKGKAYPLAFFMADVRLESALPHTENHVWLHRDGSFAALPLPEPDTWRLFIEVTRQSDHVQGSITLEDIRRFMGKRAPGMNARISGEPLWLSDFRISCRMVDRMHDERVFLAGDAAHIHSPTGGQGITTGMQDAVNLAWKLARVCRGAPRALLNTYDEERLPHAAEVLRETDRTTSILFAPNPLLRVLRDFVVLPILRSPWVQRRMFGKFSQLHVHYRGSSLSSDRAGWWPSRGIRAGDRAPDVTFVRGPSRTRTTLFTLMGPLRPVVLFSGVRQAADLCEGLRSLDIDAYVVTESETPPPSSHALCLFDVHGDFARLYGSKPNSVLLIRPDGHVGLTLSPVRLEELADYLELLCDPAQVRLALR